MWRFRLAPGQTLKITSRSVTDGSAGHLVLEAYIAHDTAHPSDANTGTPLRATEVIAVFSDSAERRENPTAVAPDRFERRS